ncbi:MAG: hypothetical protein ACE5EM_00990 [Sphingomonadales bacterium]
MSQLAQQHQTDEVDKFRKFQRLVEGTNISRDTLLATDYLNHFNEIVMLLEMVPDVPELLDEAKEWRPMGYERHFSQSSFPDKELAIAAYAHVPSDYRVELENLIEQMDRLVEEAISSLEATSGDSDYSGMQRVCTTACESLRDLIARVGAVIRGPSQAVEQSEVDELFDF